MGRPGSSLWWSWLLCAALSLGANADPVFVVLVPAVVESGSTVQFCVSLLRLRDVLTVTVSLESRGERRQLYKDRLEQEYNCATFQAPVVENSEIQNFEVEVKGKRFEKNETRKIQIINYGVKTFIQTDKPLYLPGQTVHFRVVTLDSQLRPAVGSYDVIEVKDPQGNRVAQWLKRSSEGKILQLSYELIPEAKEGTYSVSVTAGRSSTGHTFQVEKYVLPKFSVDIQAPAEVSIAVEQVEVKACAKYTFGQSVQGSMQIEMCRFPDWNRFSSEELNVLNPVCHKEHQQVAKDGCMSFYIKTEQFFNETNELRMKNEYAIVVKMTEQGTGFVQPIEHKVKLSYQIGKVEFVDPPKGYRTGNILDVKVRALHHNDTPVYNTTVHLKRFSQHLQTLQTDQDGLALFKVNTSSFSGDVSLRVTLYNEYMSTYKKPHFTEASLRLTEMKTMSEDTTSLEIKEQEHELVCGAEGRFTLMYTYVEEITGMVNLMFLVLSRGAIVHFGQDDSATATITRGDLTFRMDITPDMAPSVSVVAIAVLPNEAVIAASRDFKIEKCFNNKVGLEFAPPSSVPGEASSLKVSASPLSLCGLSAVDKSVLIMKPGKSLDPDQFFSLLPVQKAQSFPEEVEDSVECVKVRNRRQIHFSMTEDVHHLLKEKGLKMLTNLFIRTPPCVNYRGTEYHRHSPYGYGYGPRVGIAFREGPRGEPVVLRRNQVTRLSSPVPPPIETIRTFFPETWIWDLVEVGESGSADLSLTVPDTITTWETEAFCLSPRGFGLAPRQQLTVFQPFFLELSLPYSVIRGESFELKATVFNYLPSCIMMEVTPTSSSDFTLTPLSGDQYTSCLCGSETKTLSWTMLPSSLGVVNVTVKAEAVPSQVQCDNEVLSVPERGRIDVVTRELRVKAEGTEVVKTYNWLFCPKGETLKEKVELSLPENVIPGSARASVSVLGDIMGRALKNLDGMLQMPYGCGEQNMALLAPNIYILQYLQDTQQLSQEVKDKAFKFLSSGYQGQLNYKHRDGAYSAFGRGQGNSWLTAFVVRSFSKARQFMYIDPEKLDESRMWLQRGQREDGCFPSLGKLFNNRMKGGVSDDVTLTAYVTAAFLEMNISTTHSAVQKSLSCLKKNMEYMENLYTTALMAYVFSLAGDTETRAQLLNKLRSQHHDEGGLVHWAAPSSASLSVETSAYALLATLSQPQLGVEELGYASKIVRWLTGQQNPYGGFQSTQDTVVALQALALYSTLVFSPDGSSSVLVQGPAGSKAKPMSFTVDQSNKLLYQEQPLESATGQYGLEVTGSMCASAQISVFYNVPTPKDVQSLAVKAESRMECNSTVLKLRLEAHYFGEQSSSNMIIIDAKMLSGFVPDKRSLTNVGSENFVDRVEQKDDHVLIYIPELTKDQTVSFWLSLGMETSVQNLKPAVVKIYDYYTPSDRAEMEYTSPCTAPAEKD